MASITVVIQPNENIRYSPSPNVSQGDTVTFQLVDIPGEVEVSFDGGNSCFTTPGPFDLNGSTLATSSSQHTVSFTAAKGPYPFTVQIFGTKERRKGGDHETKNGGLDVTTDPPKEADKK